MNSTIFDKMKWSFRNHARTKQEDDGKQHVNPHAHIIAHERTEDESKQTSGSGAQDEKRTKSSTNAKTREINESIN